MTTTLTHIINMLNEERARDLRITDWTGESESDIIARFDRMVNEARAAFDALNAEMTAAWDDMADAQAAMMTGIPMF